MNHGRIKYCLLSVFMPRIQATFIQDLPGLHSTNYWLSFWACLPKSRLFLSAVCFTLSTSSGSPFSLASLSSVSSDKSLHFYDFWAICTTPWASTFASSWWIPCWSGRHLCRKARWKWCRQRRRRARLNFLYYSDLQFHQQTQRQLEGHQSYRTGICLAVFWGFFYAFVFLLLLRRFGC